MPTTPDYHERMANMVFTAVYPHQVANLEKKGRTEEELHQVIHWLTGMDKVVEELARGKTLEKITREE